MVKKVGSYEAKIHLPKLLESVEKGQTYTITRRGIPVALLIPAPKERSDSVIEVVKKLRTLRKENNLSGISIRKMIKTGQK